MSNFFRVAFALMVLLATGGSLFAAEPNSGAGIGAGIGAGLAIVGAGIGIGLVGWSALAAIARQPEQKGPIQVNMIVMAALVEGAAIIALLVVCYALINVAAGK